MPLKRKKSQVFLDADVALNIVPQEVQNGVKLAPISGILDVKDNVHNIHKCDESVDGVPKQLVNSLFKKQVTYEYGTMSQMDVDLFLKKLKQDGFSDVKVTQSSETEGVVTKIQLVNEEIEVCISDKSTHITCRGKQSWRLKVRDLLMSCMNKF